MNVNPLAETRRPTNATPHVRGVSPTRPVRRSDEGTGATVDEHAVDTASDRRAERTQRRAEKFEARLDHLIQYKLATVDAKIERFIERHDLSDEAVAAIADYRAQLESTLTELRAGLADGGYEPEAIAAFRDAVKEALGTLRDDVRGVLDDDFAGAPAPENGEVDGDVDGEDTVAADVSPDTAIGQAAEESGAEAAQPEIDGASETTETGAPDGTESSESAAEIPGTVTISADLVTGLQDIRDAIDAFLESVAVDDAFDVSEILLPTPIVDIQA